MDVPLKWLLTQRFELVKEVWEIKKKFGKEALDKKQWEKVLSWIQNQAQEKNMDSLFVKKVWEVIHAIALKIENLIENTSPIILLDEELYVSKIGPIRQKIRDLNIPLLNALENLLKTDTPESILEQIERIGEEILKTFQK